MVVHAAYFNERAAFSSNDPSDVFVKILLQLRSNQWLAIFGAENNMEQQLCAGTSHKSERYQNSPCLPGQKSYVDFCFRGLTPPAGRPIPLWGRSMYASNPHQKFKIPLQMNKHMVGLAG